MEGWGWRSVHDPEVLPQVMAEWEASIATGEPFDMVFPIRGADGDFRPFLTRIVPVKDEKGQVARWFGTNTDIGEEKRQEEALRERERFVQRILDASPGVVYVFDLEACRTTFINQRAQTSLGLGLGPGELIAAGGRFIREHVHPDDLPALREHAGRIAEAADDDLLSVEYRMRHADGRWLWFASRDVVFARASDGRPSQVLGVATDVTDRKRVEESLRYHLDLIKSITDNATTPILMLDDQSRCTFMNPAAEAMTGFAFSEVEGRFLHDFIHHHYPDGRPYPRAECPIVRALTEHAEFRDHEDLFFRKDGGRFPVVLNARVTYKEGTAVGTVLEVRDVTADKKAEEVSRFLSEAGDMLAGLQDLRSTLDHVARRSLPFLCDWCVIDLIDKDRQIQRIASAHVDPAKEPALKEMVTRYPSSWSSASLVVRVLTTGEPEIRPVVPESLVEEVSRDDDHARLVRTLEPRSFMAVPLKVRGRTLGAIGFVRTGPAARYDAGDLEVAQELARRAAVAIDNAQLFENLRDVDRKKTEFLATLAHELRNPLAPIRNGLQLTKLAGGNGEALETARSMMERQLNQLVRLVDDLMDVSRISMGKIELRRERVELKRVLEGAVETSRALIDEMGHELTVSVPGGPIPLDADLTRLSQVFSNLLHNAAKYAEPGGRIHLTATREGPEAVVSVRDEGIGMEADQLTRIFELFSQVDQSLEKSRGGLGIGLSLVKRLLEMHGGDIEARSEGPGKGSEFVVRLPLAPEEPTAPAAEPQQADELGGPLRVLIVDDNRDSADSLAMMLKMLGNETRTAYDGEEAVAAAAEFRPAVILLDIGLPKLNGHEACRRIRSQPWGNSAYIIAQTGWGQEEDRRRTQDAGFDKHMVKPIDPDQLLKVLAELRPTGA